MPDFILVTTLNGLQELYIVKPLLEEESINFYIKNENFIQMDPLYSVGTGGLDVMVVEDDAQRAYDILKDAGYIIEETEPLNLPLLDSIRKWFYSLSAISFRKYKVIAIVIGIVVLVTSSVVLWYNSILKNAYDLVGSDWYVNAIYKDGRELKLNTISVIEITYPDGSSPEMMSFYNNETVSLPGLNSPPITGVYSVKDESSVIIEKCNRFEDVFNGTYTVNFDEMNDKVVLFNNNIEIQLQK
jgi:hypothetical protein